MPSNVIIYTVGFSTSSSPIDAQGLNLLNLRRPKQKCPRRAFTRCPAGRAALSGGAFEYRVCGHGISSRRSRPRLRLQQLQPALQQLHPRPPQRLPPRRWSFSGQKQFREWPRGPQATQLR